MQIVWRRINISTLTSTEWLSEWMEAGLIIRVSERLSLLGTKDKCKVSVLLTMETIRIL